MNIYQAFTLAKTGSHVRPVCWTKTNPDHWVEWFQSFFVEGGSMEEMRHRLHLDTEEDFLGEWEVFPS